ncbi:F-box protein: endocytic membrane traffic, recycling ReCYcling 1 [Taxawa tesnikishii (nom. ined.)]|nr:F-box protein: endocytic membrane traffic, recycling ReCYcling 1 [Dothideales sp. JES 119]
MAQSDSHADLLVFRTFRDPEQQARILADLKVFARSDTTQGWQEREGKLESMIGMFENAVLREFEQGYDAQDVDGRMKRYAHVLVTLNGGAAGVDFFIQNHPYMLRKEQLGNPLDCVDGVAYGHCDLGPSQRFFERLAVMLNDQVSVIDRVFPQSVDVLLPFVDRICEDIVADYLTSLFDEAHDKNIETYLKAVSGVFEQAMRFAVSLQPTKGSKPDFADEVHKAVTKCFEPHVDLYLTEELDFFRSKSEAEVGAWEKQLSDEEARAESFFMSNINRQAVKRDFLTSFKKVVMMPVNALPAFPLSAQAPTAKPAPNPAVAELNSRPATPSLTPSSNPDRSSTPLPAEAPTTELAAKTAIMNSRLEGIKSLFSIEVALNLIHHAKSSLERAAILVRIGGQSGEEAKEQCETIFVTLLSILGQRHIKTGFDKAVRHLSSYNPREAKSLAENGSALSSAKVGVEPLVTFLELVNVGDLIQQMVDVFYAQELVAPKLTDRDDFLNPAVKEKKRFEQMLDERVAAGMSKGIDVLMDEVEYICATTQLATDFNPGVNKDGKGPVIVDIGPSQTAKRVVDTVGSHTSMLVGSTDKNMLDVFNQEVGLRLFGVLCKHIKRQRISVDGAIKLISDINHYSTFVATLRQKSLLPYFSALRELSQIYLIDCTPPSSTAGKVNASYAKELATIIADTDRYRGIFGAEEVYEFAERRADWYTVRRDVERAMYGIGCLVM